MPHDYIPRLLAFQPPVHLSPLLLLPLPLLLLPLQGMPHDYMPRLLAFHPSVDLSLTRHWRDHMALVRGLAQVRQARVAGGQRGGGAVTLTGPRRAQRGEGQSERQGARRAQEGRGSHRGRGTGGSGRWVWQDRMGGCLGSRV